MKALIRKIILYGKPEEKPREVNLTEGLNIITGDSKTGKSALIEIVDYCLFSSRSSIPKGKIIDFTSLFAIVLQTDQKYIVIARPSPKTSDLNKAYFKIETDNQFLNNMTINYFEALVLQNIKSVQNQVEHHLGLAISDMTDDIDASKKTGKASMRNIVSLLFQHQNLIANKHAIFYRFDDISKRQRTINEFPVFMNWVDGEYYGFVRGLEEKERQHRAEMRIRKKIELNKDQLKIKLADLIENYYLLIGLKLDESLTFPDLKKIGLDLPIIQDIAFSSSDLERSRLEYESELANKKNELSNKEKSIKELEDLNNNAGDYSFKLKLIGKTLEHLSDNSNMTCPVCKNSVSSVEETLKEINSSKDKLIDDIEKVATYRIDNSEQIEFLRNERDKLKNRIRDITAKISTLQQQDNEFKEKRKLRDQAMKLKGVIETSVKQILDENSFAGERADLKDLENEIEYLKNKIKGYNLESKYEQSNVFLHKRMNSICDKLDFEEELKPSNLHFNLKNFEFYQQKGNENIYLYEMGSGANWLACHLSLFLSLLYLACKENKSSIPSILFLDQPSQVYFPKGFEKTDENLDEYEENIKQVQNIFEVLVEVMSDIKKDCDFLPQIVVMEHADKLALKNADFESFVRKRWSKQGEKLI